MTSEGVSLTNISVVGITRCAEQSPLSSAPAQTCNAEEQWELFKANLLTHMPSLGRANQCPVSSSVPAHTPAMDQQSELFKTNEIQKPPRLEELWAVVEMAARDGFAEVEPIKWETWWPGGEAKRTAAHIGKRTMRSLAARGWVVIEKSVATLTSLGYRAAAHFEEKGYQR